ncbi:hypothetical protein ACJX0J_008939, partial [Zea mays]
WSRILSWMLNGILDPILCLQNIENTLLSTCLFNLFQVVAVRLILLIPFIAPMGKRREIAPSSCVFVKEL